MAKYGYVMNGVNRTTQTWQVSGEISLDGDKGDLVVATERVLSEAFLKLTKGEAIFGHPGVACQGPYKVRTLVINVME